MLLTDHPVALFAVMLAGLLLVVEIGLRLRRTVAVDADGHDQIKGTRDSIGVLFSLLLGFTLAMVLSRFDLRRHLVVEEANAIGTTSLRAEMLSEPARTKTQQLLREYTASRLDFFRAGLDEDKLGSALLRSKNQQNELWQQAVLVAQQNPTPITSLFVQSLNETIDLDAKRVAALENRIPVSIWWMLILIATLTCLTIGYSHTSRLLLSALVPALMTAIVMSLIADLDTPRSGLIQIGQQSLERLQGDIQLGR